MKLLILIFLLLDLNAKELEVAKGNWPPYNYYENNIHKGFVTEVTNSIFKDMGYTASFKIYPWVRAESLILNDKVDALYSASKKDNREEKCYYPDEELFNSKYVLFFRSNEVKKFKTLDDLKDLSIGVVKGYAYSDSIWKTLRKNRNYINFINDTIGFKNLASGKIDCFLAETGNGIYLSKKLNINDKIDYSPKPLVEKPYYIIFSKERVTDSFVKRFSENLKKFKKTKKFKNIYNLYLK